MNTRLKPLILDDFTGGINLRANQFHLAENESPYMLNMEVDPRGGIFTRRGWSRWFDGADIGPLETWEPRNAASHIYGPQAASVFVTNNNKIYESPGTGIFTDMSVPCNALPHLADFASWGASVYIAPGRDAAGIGGAPVRWTDPGPAVVLGIPAGPDPGETMTDPGGWNNDYTNPQAGYMPISDHVEPHNGYLFVASTRENDGSGSTSHPNRIRWSHPGGQQEDWAFNDYIDIDVGGGYITGLMSFQDHLLIFKDDSLWALYGYSNESWQLIKVSRAVGAPSPTAITRSEGACYFYSNSGRNAIYAYDGGVPIEISSSIRVAVEEITFENNVWVAWVHNRLWCNLPWLNSETPGFSNEGTEPNDALLTGVSTDAATTTFVFDLTVGQGIWTLFRPGKGALGPIVEGIDVTGEKPLAVYWADPENNTNRCCLALSAVAGAYDEIDEGGAVTNWPAGYTTGWKHLDWPDLRKSWRRPRFVIRNANMDVGLRIESFKDYGESEASRIHQLVIDKAGNPYWRADGASDPAGDGFDWDDGTKWPSSTNGATLARTTANAPEGGGFGKARAMQFRISTDNAYEGTQWGLDAMIFKVLSREFTT